MVILLDPSWNSSDTKGLGAATLEKNRFTWIFPKFASPWLDALPHYLGSVAQLAKHLQPEVTSDEMLLDGLLKAPQQQVWDCQVYLPQITRRTSARGSWIASIRSHLEAIIECIFSSDDDLENYKIGDAFNINAKCCYLGGGKHTLVGSETLQNFPQTLL